MRNAIDAERPAENARERLLGAALRLFAERGFARTSTRELADAAQVNVAAISYYFGDKGGLYRAAFFEPMGETEADVARIADPSLTLDEALAGFFHGFVAPLREGEAVRWCMKLHFRELLEPTGLWAQLMERGMRPLHDALVQVLQRHLGVAEPDEELLALAVAVAALGVHLHVGHDVTLQLAPQLVRGDGALDRWALRLVRLARAMVESERARRATAVADANAEAGGAAQTREAGR
jgi:TetR/AcrR family transcriptional regulator, regulator of cefoperazone and chloramphenicol sensitivity